ncbi:MAG: hypothetical protein V3R72_05925 [Gammaproteobacteria bacterium]
MFSTTNVRDPLYRRWSDRQNASIRQSSQRLDRRTNGDFIDRTLAYSMYVSSLLSAIKATSLSKISRTTRGEKALKGSEQMMKSNCPRIGAVSIDRQYR